MKNYIEYVQNFDNTWSPRMGKKPISEITEKEKLDCVCDWKEEDCEFCEWRWWIYNWQEWQFSCECWASTARASCAENAELDCECMDEE